jgi:hypothetical protein
MPELLGSAVPLPAPIVIPEKRITQVELRYCNYGYITKDASGNQVTVEKVAYNPDELAAKTTLLAELVKDAKADAAANVG